MRAKFIDIDGIRTRYLCEGETNKRALLLVHGGGVSADTWLFNIDALAKTFAVYAPDNIGHGFTASIDLGEDLPQPHTTRHLARFMEVLGIERYAVAGSSYGALIASLLYFEHPKRVEKLILIGSSSVFDSDENNKKALQGAYDNAAKAIGSPDLAACRQRMNNAVFDPSCVPESLLMMQLTQYAQPDRVEFYVKANRNRVNAKGPMQYRVVDRLEQIDVPTLVITGKQDKRTDWQNTERAVKRLPKGQAQTIDRCGHLPYIEHPQVFNSLVGNFLSS